MITPQEAWEVAMDAAEAQKPVTVTCRDEKKFSGVLTHVDHDYLVLLATGKRGAGPIGFPLTDLTNLEVKHD